MTRSKSSELEITGRCYLWLEKSEDYLSMLDSLDEQLTSQQKVLDSADKDVNSRKDFRMAAVDVNEKLRTALSDADRIRLIARISVQFILVALVFYLIKIYSSHYRHFRSVALFYRGRSTTLMMIARSTDAVHSALKGYFGRVPRSHFWLTLNWMVVIIVSNLRHD